MSVNLAQTVARASWTRWGQVLCSKCYAPTGAVWAEPTENTCLCDRCNVLVDLSERPDVALLARLRDVLNATPDLSGFHLEQTGGMCVALLNAGPSRALLPFVMVTVAEEVAQDGASLFRIGQYVWNGGSGDVELRANVVGCDIVVDEVLRLMWRS